MLNRNEVYINLEKMFGFKRPHFNLKNLCDTIIAKKEKVKYCHEYLSKFNRKNHRDLEQALQKKDFDFSCQQFDCNIFNESIFYCVFCSFICTNVSIVDNLEDIVIELFPEKLGDYGKDRKRFSFPILCSKLPDKPLTLVLKKILETYPEFSKIQNLRNQIMHSTLLNITHQDNLVSTESYVNAQYTLSGNNERLSDFAKNINSLLDDIEEQVFNCLITHGKNSIA